MKKHFAMGVIALAGVLCAPSARCEETRVTLGAGTDLPLGIGGIADVEVGPRIRLGVSVYWLPPAYVALSDEVGQAVGGYNDVTSELVRAATENALTLRFRAGWRPWADSGFYVEANYSLLTLGGAFTTEDLAGAAGLEPRSDGGIGWDLSSTVHQIGIEFGWRFELHDRLSLKVGLGGSFTVAANVTADARQAQSPQIAEAIETIGAEYLEQTYTNYVHVPVLTVALGWDVFVSK